MVQILIHLPESEQSSLTQLTYVETKRFVTPVRRLGVSGGTAPFFSLQLAATEGKCSGDYWIGKDLSRAMDEVNFYEKATRLSALFSSGFGRNFFLGSCRLQKALQLASINSRGLVSANLPI